MLGPPALRWIAKNLLPKYCFTQKIVLAKKIAQENPPKIVLPKIMYCIPFLPFPNMDHKSPKMLQNFGVFQKIKKSAKLPNLDKRPQLHIMSVFTYSINCKKNSKRKMSNVFFLQEKLFSILIFVFLFFLSFPWWVDDTKIDQKCCHHIATLPTSMIKWRGGGGVMRNVWETNQLSFLFHANRITNQPTNQPTKCLSFCCPFSHRPQYHNPGPSDLTCYVWFRLLS